MVWDWVMGHGSCGSRVTKCDCQLWHVWRLTRLYGYTAWSLVWVISCRLDSGGRLWERYVAWQLALRSRQLTVTVHWIYVLMISFAFIFAGLVNAPLHWDLTTDKWQWYWGKQPATNQLTLTTTTTTINNNNNNNNTINNNSSRHKDGPKVVGIAYWLAILHFVNDSTCVTNHIG